MVKTFKYVEHPLAMSYATIALATNHTLGIFYSLALVMFGEGFVGIGSGFDGFEAFGILYYLSYPVVAISVASLVIILSVFYVHIVRSRNVKALRDITITIILIQAGLFGYMFRDFAPLIWIGKPFAFFQPAYFMILIASFALWIAAYLSLKESVPQGKWKNDEVTSQYGHLFDDIRSVMK